MTLRAALPIDPLPLVLPMTGLALDALMRVGERKARFWPVELVPGLRGRRDDPGHLVTLEAARVGELPVVHLPMLVTAATTDLLG